MPTWTLSITLFAGTNMVICRWSSPVDDNYRPTTIYLRILEGERGWWSRNGNMASLLKLVKFFFGMENQFSALLCAKPNNGKQVSAFHQNIFIQSKHSLICTACTSSKWFLFIFLPCIAIWQQSFWPSIIPFSSSKTSRICDYLQATTSYNPKYKNPLLFDTNTF